MKIPWPRQDAHVARIAGPWRYELGPICLLALPSDGITGGLTITLHESNAWLMHDNFQRLYSGARWRILFIGFQHIADAVTRCTILRII